MTVKTYKISDDERNVTKTLDEDHANSYTCVARDTVDILRPQIIVSSASMPDVNYMYISDFGRYYYIRDVSAWPNGKWLITGEVDVLMTFSSQIRQLVGTVDRQQSLANSYLGDERYVAKAYKAIVTKTFPNSMTGDSFILMTVG